MSPKRKKGFGENKYAKFHLYITKTDAWKALPLRAKALYPLLMLQWAGDRYNNNGEIFLSLRQAAERLGCSKDTARQAFWDLQMKGFIKVQIPGYLGVSGVGKATKFEITEYPMPGARTGSKLFLSWREEEDFPIKKGRSKI